MIQRLKAEPDLRICSEAFLCWIHEQFYNRLPADMRFAATLSGDSVPVVPGELRDRGISVGRHDAPIVMRDDGEDFFLIPAPRIFLTYCFFHYDLLRLRRR